MSTLSYWEREELLRCDVLVVGGGIIGLSAAITLKEKYPNCDVVVLEREILPSGASTKNAGFACYGSLTEILCDVETMGVDATIQLIENRKRGLDMLRARLGDSRMGLEPNGGYELLWADASSAIEHIEFVNTLMQPIFGNEYFTQRNSLIHEFGFSIIHVQHLIATKHEGAINSGKTMKNLALLASSIGVRIITGADVSAIQESNNGVDVEVYRHVLNDTLTFKAEQVVVCTNALARQFMPELTLKPARGQVLITEPIPQLRFKGVFHFNEGYYYFRNVGNRVLFGGGRNLDFDGETTSEFQTTDNIQSSLENYLRTVILPDTPYTVDMRWAGIMGFGTNKQPVVRHIGKRIVVGFGCNGMGVAIGSSIGAQTAELVEL